MINEVKLDVDEDNYSCLLVTFMAKLKSRIIL